MIFLFQTYINIDNKTESIYIFFFKETLIENFNVSENLTLNLVHSPVNILLTIFF